MAKAEELLNSILASNTFEESHIVIGSDRFITVPENLKRLGVQYDHNIETVTFDCPRYWDNHDMSTMDVYVNYICADHQTGSYKVNSVKTDRYNQSIMHFDWTISKNVTMANGPIAFLVCIRNTGEDGIEKNHWNSEICKDCYISAGMEYDGSNINEIYPDIIEQWRREVLAITDDIVAARENGEFKGEQGDPGVSPTIQVTDMQGGHRITITDINGTKSFDVMDTIIENTDALNEVLSRFAYISSIAPTTEPALWFYTDVHDAESGGFDENVGVYLSYVNKGIYTALYPRTRKDLVFGMDEIDNFIAANKGIVAHSDDGITYTATVPGITELKVGASFVMIPDLISSTSIPELIVNGLGPIDIGRRSSVASGEIYEGLDSSTWLSADTPVRVTYDGTYWVIDTPVISGSDLVNTVPIERGGTNATSIEDAAKNLKFSSLAYATKLNDISDIGEAISVGKYYIDKDQYNANWAEGSQNFPFVMNWNWCILTVEDAKGEGNVYSNFSDVGGASCSFVQRIESNIGEKFYRYLKFTYGQCSYGDWIREYTSSTPLILNKESYGEVFPDNPIDGTLFFKRYDGCYIYNAEDSCWEQYSSCTVI